jgi:RNA polymerase sigma-70 factor (ECF subfamily)
MSSHATPPSTLMVDEPTFESFYEATKHSLWRYIVKMTKNDALADDIFQDAYIKFLQSSIEHADNTRMRSYLYRIATNLMNDHWRKVKHERSWLEEEPVLDPSSTIGNEIDLRLDINKAFNHLSRQHCSLLWLAYVEGYDHKEIARMLNLREASIKVLLFRAKHKLIALCQRMGITSESTS